MAADGKRCQGLLVVGIPICGICGLVERWFVIFHFYTHSVRSNEDRDVCFEKS
jgi:hypothetical protein